MCVSAAASHAAVNGTPAGLRTPATPPHVQLHPKARWLPQATGPGAGTGLGLRGYRVQHVVFFEHQTALPPRAGDAGQERAPPTHAPRTRRRTLLRLGGGSAGQGPDISAALPGASSPPKFQSRRGRENGRKGGSGPARGGRGAAGRAGPRAGGPGVSPRRAPAGWVTSPPTPAPA